MRRILLSLASGFFTAMAFGASPGSSWFTMDTLCTIAVSPYSLLSFDKPLLDGALRLKR
jgi:hypothetical protein